MKLYRLTASLIALIFAVLGFGIWWDMSSTLPRVVEPPVNCAAHTFADFANTEWSAEEISVLCSMWIGNLPPLSANPSNIYSDNDAAAKLGQRIFFDTQFSANETISCASCHQPEKNFTDGLAQPVGGGPRKTQTIVGTAYSSWFFWSGHKDSLWSQALEPLESPLEHDFSRQQVASIFSTNPVYRAEYESIFGEIPALTSDEAVTEVFVNVGKAIEAYERKLLPAASRFDDYVQAVMEQDTNKQQMLFSSDEKAGLALYINEAQCLNCHNGPLLTNNEFHGTDVFGIGVPDLGRQQGALDVLQDEFNCVSQYSDADDGDCLHLRHIRTEGIELQGAFKTPTLRNIAEAAPYTHTGQFADLASILEHYNNGGTGGRFLGNFGHNELEPLGLSNTQLVQIEAFLLTLSGGVAVDMHWLAAID